ncbi:uncharacterized protein LOC136029586 [Artemia franciscana]|uniref:uncharacterized protein LOC136029586 n=1 Tax=Artemia franciscana TaxID=6661 RepID=UPI0032DB75DD
MRPGVCVPNQTTIRHLIATMNRNATNLSKEDRDMMHEYLCHTENTSKNVYEAYAFHRIAAGRAIMDKCTQEAEKCSAPQKIRDTDDEEVASCMDEATRKRVAKAAFNRVLEEQPIDGRAKLKTASLKLIRRINPEIKSTAILKSVKDLYRKQLKQARAEEILKKMSEKRGIGADLTEALTEASLQMAIRRLGYQDTVPSLEEVQQTYRRFRIPKLFPSEPLVDDYLTQCVLNQSWPGMTVAQSLNKGAGQGVYATIPFYKNQVVVEIHGKRMATIEANRLFRSLLGEDDGSNYFLTVDQDVTIDAREEACACHPHQQCFGRLVNHKANEDGPNLKSKALVVDGLKRPFLVATRDITAGEELCFDYGVRPGQFNEGYEQMFLLPEKSRKRKRSALMELAMDETQEEVRSEEPQMDTHTNTATDTEPHTQTHRNTLTYNGGDVRRSTQFTFETDTLVGQKAERKKSAAMEGNAGNF